MIKHYCFVGLIMVVCLMQACTPESKEQQPVQNTATTGDTTFFATLINDSTTTLFLVRHAEKELTGTDPDLTADGNERAAELSRLLGKQPVARIYSTQYKRTKQTVTPLANSRALGITEYSATLSAQQFTTQLLNENKNKVAVVVGHSNTLPEILNQFDTSFHVSIGDYQYSDFFVVQHRPGTTRILQLKYGKPTP